MTYVEWVAFNHAYGPWYRIKNTKVVVQPDMDRSRWYWCVPEDRFHDAMWGHAPTKKAAQAAAQTEWLKRT
jgi:hypothetical protein